MPDKLDAEYSHTGRQCCHTGSVACHLSRGNCDESTQQLCRPRPYFSAAALESQPLRSHRPGTIACRSASSRCKSATAARWRRCGNYRSPDVGPGTPPPHRACLTPDLLLRRNLVHRAIHGHTLGRQSFNTSRAGLVGLQRFRSGRGKARLIRSSRDNFGEL